MYTYSAMRSGLEAEANTTTAFLRNYLDLDFNECYSSCVLLVRNYENKDKLELQFVDEQGNVVASSYGLFADERVETNEVSEALSTRSTVYFVGRNPATDERIMSVSTPLIYSDGRVIGVLRFVTATRTADRYILLTLLVALGFVATVVLIVYLSSRLYFKSILVPVSEITETAKRIAGGSYGVQIQKKFDDEIGELADTINDMSNKISQTERMQSEFVSSVSHELRTPIAVIKGYADMLDRWGKEDKEILEEAIAAIRSESDHMNTLVEQLLFLARGDAGRQKLTLQKMSLTAIMKEVHEESEMIDKNHTYEFVSGAGEVICYGDPAMLKQSIRILVDNAAKYTTVGDTITLRVGVNQELRPFYSVQDNGVGMSSHDVEHIFERFYRSDTARNSKTGGTGLGLAIAKWIVNRHHGTIMVQSRPEIGTRFTIILHAQENTFNDAVVIGA